MKEKTRKNLLCIYDLVLALGAIYIGVMMISSSNEMFSQYPKEWLTRVPFKSWIFPGIIAIVLFGLGNIISAILSFKKDNSKSWIASAIMGGLLFMGVITQVIILEKTYLATVEFTIFSIIQLCLCGYSFLEYGKESNRG